MGVGFDEGEECPGGGGDAVGVALAARGAGGFGPVSVGILDGA